MSGNDMCQCHSGTTVVSDIRPPATLMLELTWEGLARAGQAEWKEKGIPGRGNSLWKGPELNGRGVSKGMKGGQHSEEGALKTSI